MIKHLTANQLQKSLYLYFKNIILVSDVIKGIKSQVTTHYFYKIHPCE